MMYRAAILGTIFIAAWMGFTIPASAQAWTIKGTCSTATIAESDGVQTGTRRSEWKGFPLADATGESRSCNARFGRILVDESVGPV